MEQNSGRLSNYSKESYIGLSKIFFPPAISAITGIGNLKARREYLSNTKDVILSAYMMSSNNFDPSSTGCWEGSVRQRVKCFAQHGVLKVQ